MKTVAKLVSLVRYPEQDVLSIEPSNTRCRRVVAILPDGQKLCWIRKTQLKMFFMNISDAGSDPIVIDIYPEIRENFGKNKITQKYVDSLQSCLLGKKFVLEGERVLDLENILRSCRA